MNMIDSIQKVLNTLNVIPVSGMENMDRMLGCFKILASMKRELESKDDTEQLGKDGGSDAS